MQYFPQKQLLAWYSKEKRDLPWRKTLDPYKIWVSEVFLQQTQVSRVIGFYTRFLEKFPNIEVLAKSSWEEFLPYFQGLGFYSRGRNMLRAAKYIVESHQGKFPRNFSELIKVPGIGPYTAAAILSFSKKEQMAAFDTNLYRIFERFLGNDSKKEQEQYAQKIYEKSEHPDLLNHALMDLGSSLCMAKKTECEKCPLRKNCDFFLSGKKIIISQKNLKKVSGIEFSLCVLHHEKKYFFIAKKSEELGFPIFFREKGKDVRHLIQEKMQKNFGVKVSVRPPFFRTLLTNLPKFFFDGFPETPKEKNVIFSFSRAQILEGNLTKQGKWISPEDFSRYSFEKVLDECLQKLQKMRFPKENHV